MRDILFKAKRTDKGEWVEGYLFETEENSYIAYNKQFNDDLFLSPHNIFIEINRNTVCQYTGLTDNTKWEDLTAEEKQDFYNNKCSEDGITIKYQNVDDVKHLWKGKKIWENDVVKYDSEDDLKLCSVVKYGEYDNSGNMDCYLGFYMDWSDTGFWLRKDIGFWTKNREIEVIGNIFDNPKLLKGGGAE